MEGGVIAEVLTRRRLLERAGGILAGAACCPMAYSADTALGAELTERSRNEGLGILTTAPSTGTFPLMYFDGKWEQIGCCGKLRQSWVILGGRNLIALDYSEMLQKAMDPMSWGPNVTVFDLSGLEQMRLPWWIRASFVAVSPNGKMIAFNGQGGPPPASGRVQLDRGLLFGPVDAAELNKIHGLREDDPQGSQGDKRPATLAWSADGSMIVYGKEGHVYVYKLREGASHFLSEGSNPLWSPDGKWISYRGPNGEAMLIDPSGRDSRQLAQGRQITHALHWSPDGHYLFLTLATRVAGAEWGQLAVLRLDDGAMMLIGERGFGVDDSGKDWVVTGRRK